MPDSQLVRENLTEYIRANRLTVMDGKDMEDFIKKIRAGQDYRGNPNRYLTRFNNAIREQRAAYLAANARRGFQTAECLEDWISRGKSYLKSPRFFNTVVGAGLAMWASGALNEVQGAVEVAAESRHFKAGLQYLSDGNLGAGYRELFAEGEGGFFGDLVDKGYPRAALNFKASFEDSMARLQANASYAVSPPPPIFSTVGKIFGEAEAPILRHAANQLYGLYSGAWFGY